MSTARHPYTSDFARRHYDAGLVEGKASTVLMVLDARGIDLTAEMRARISQCTDLDQLDSWIVRLATVATADQVFG